MDWIERLAEERIQKAIEEGAFDELEFAGKPLALNPDGLVPEDLRLAYKILKDAGFVPPEIELRKEIVGLRELLATIDDDAEYQRIAERLNDRVLRLNLLWKRSFDLEDHQTYGAKLKQRLSPSRQK